MKGKKQRGESVVKGDLILLGGYAGLVVNWKRFSIARLLHPKTKEAPAEVEVIGHQQSQFDQQLPQLLYRPNNGNTQSWCVGHPRKQK